jgi:hypothetical protein
LRSALARISAASILQNNQLTHMLPLTIHSISQDQRVHEYERVLLSLQVLTMVLRRHGDTFFDACLANIAAQTLATRTAAHVPAAGIVPLTITRHSVANVAHKVVRMLRVKLDNNNLQSPHGTPQVNGSFSTPSRNISVAVDRLRTSASTNNTMLKAYEVLSRPSAFSCSTPSPAQKPFMSGGNDQARPKSAPSLSRSRRKPRAQTRATRSIKFTAAAAPTRERLQRLKAAKAYGNSWSNTYAGRTLDKAPGLAT